MTLYPRLERALKRLEAVALPLGPPTTSELASIRASLEGHPTGSSHRPLLKRVIESFMKDPRLADAAKELWRALPK